MSKKRQRILGAYPWEIQSQKKTDFARRMFVYNYRIFDCYNRSVASLAILSDENLNWRPNQFSYSLWNCKVGIEFPAIKLLDYRDQWDELEKSRNPFAVAVMAHLKVHETRGDYEERKRWKFYLARRLYERGYKREDIILLLKFIDWIMRLPRDLENSFWQEVYKYEEEKKMPYMLSMERSALEKGIKQGIEQGELLGIKESLLDALETKYEKIPKKIAQSVNSVGNVDTLRALHRHAIKCGTLKEFEEKMKSVIEGK